MALTQDDRQKERFDMQAIPILVYHSVGRTCGPAYRRWLVTERELDAHLQALTQRGYRSMTVRDLALLRCSGQPIPPRTCVITFDDGLRDFAEAAMPVLVDRKFAATLYVATGFVGATARWLADLDEGNRPMLNWTALRDLHDAGIEIGAHSVTHPELDTLSFGKATSELRDSKRALEDGLGAAVTTFAYPHGYASRATRRIAKDAGYLAACRVRHALSDETENLFALSRIVVTSEVTPDALLDMIETPQLPVAPPADRLIATGWRAARRLRALHRSVFPRRQVAGAESGA